MKYGMFFDITRCNGCYSCFLACKDEYEGNDHLPACAATCPGISFIKVNEMEYGTGSRVKVDYVPVPCQQCTDPACMKKFPEAIWKRPDGIVIIDPVKAKGIKEMVDACPYGAIVWNEEAQLPQKCTFCAHMLDAGAKQTRCSECCPNQSLIFGDLDDPNSDISKYIAIKGDKVEKFMPQLGTGSAVDYYCLPKPFIAGEIIANGACCKGAKITCTCDECSTVLETVTDFLGNFEIRYLPENKHYTLKIEAEGYKVKEIKAFTKVAVNLGGINLEK